MFGFFVFIETIFKAVTYAMKAVKYATMAVGLFV